ncbi:hypothetical protein EDC01DRAFT_727501 [Geopyxis carbonaria]|nr:hypothetical protein EDC01DRAFT_727501 [Geopyxis carbonaria]
MATSNEPPTVHFGLSLSYPIYDLSGAHPLYLTYTLFPKHARPLLPLSVPFQTSAFNPTGHALHIAEKDSGAAVTFDRSAESENDATVEFPKAMSTYTVRLDTPALTAALKPDTAYMLILPTNSPIARAGQWSAAGATRDTELRLAATKHVTFKALAAIPPAPLEVELELSTDTVVGELWITATTTSRHDKPVTVLSRAYAGPTPVRSVLHENFCRDNLRIVAMDGTGEWKVGAGADYYGKDGYWEGRFTTVYPGVPIVVRRQLVGGEMSSTQLRVLPEMRGKELRIRLEPWRAWWGEGTREELFAGVEGDGERKLKTLPGDGVMDLGPAESGVFRIV